MFLGKPMSKEDIELYSENPIYRSMIIDDSKKLLKYCSALNKLTFEDLKFEFDIWDYDASRVKFYRFIFSIKAKVFFKNNYGFLITKTYDVHNNVFLAGDKEKYAVVYLEGNENHYEIAKNPLAKNFVRMLMSENEITQHMLHQQKYDKEGD